MTKIQHKRSSVLVSGAAKAPTSAQLDYGELAINYSSTDPQFFIKDSSGSVISILSSYAPLDGATFTGDVNFDAEAIIKGDSTNSGALTLNSETNTKYVKIQAPANSSLTSYTLTLPNDDGGSGEVLSTDGSGGLSWAYAAMSTADKTKLDGIAAGAEVNVNADWTASSGDAEILNKPTNVSAFTNDAGYLTSPDGGNAQTLDSLDSTQFLRSDANDSFSGSLTSTTSAAGWLQHDGSHASPYIRMHTNGVQNGYIQFTTSEAYFWSDRLSKGIRLSTNLEYYDGGAYRTIWHSANDGSGSGLDADSLDGYEGNNYIGKNGASYYNPNTWIDFNSTNAGLYWSGGIGTGWHIYPSSTGTMRFRTSGNTCAFRLETNSGTTRGHVYATNANEVGFLDSDGNWAIRHTRDLRTEFLVNNTEYAEINSDYLNHTSDIRTPIFYDSNNTGYYLDPASTSNLNGLEANSTTVDSIGFTGNGTNSNQSAHSYRIFQESGAWSNPYPDLRIAYHTGIKLGAHYNYNGIRFYNDSNMATQVMSVNNVSDPLGANNVYVNNSLQAGSSLRAPIFYDSNDTNYYVNPASTSYVVYLGRRAHHTGHLVGSYNSVGANQYKSNPIYTIGSSYNPTDAALSNMYGIGYSHTNASFFGLSGQSGWGMYVAADGDARVQLNGTNGAVSCTGNITAYASDQRLKTNIKPIDKALNKLMKISGVEYDWIDECESEYEFQPRQKHEIGVIAQEVQEVLPELVFEAPFNSLYKAKTGWKQIQKRLQTEENIAAKVEGREAMEITKAFAKQEFEKLPLKEREAMCTDHNFLTVDYERITPLLIEAIKELSVRLTVLETKQ